MTNSAMAMVVRPAKVADAGSIATSHIRSWQSGYAGVVSGEVLQGLGSKLVERTLRWQANILGAETEGHFVLVCELDGEVVGILAGGPCRDAGHEALGEVHACYVDPDHWRKGVASALMDAGIERLTKAGHTEAVLWVLADNARARSFYERHSWIADGAEKMYELEGDRYLELRYRRPLSQGSVA